MAGLLLRLWSLPWPSPMRARLSELATVPWLQLLPDQRSLIETNYKVEVPN